MTQFRLDSRMITRIMIASGGLLLILACMFAFAKSVSAHGYIDSPGSRAILCKNGVNTNCGNIVYEPQSLEGIKGFPAAGPADGKIASAGLAAFAPLDAQTSTRWSKVNMSSGTNTFTWKFTARHATSSYRYFITKSTWNPNSPLTRAQFDLTPFCTVPGNGQQPPETLSHSCNVPSRTGYHVILGVWDIHDTQNAWYIVIDANFGGSNPPGDTTAPSAPSNLRSSNIGTTTATLAWNASSDNTGVTGYEVFSGSSTTPIATTSGTSVNLTNLSAGTTYNFTVKAYDAAGNRSAASSSQQVTTSQPPANDTTAPAAPTNLHVMGTPTSSSVSLMWNPATDNVGVTGYRVYQGSTLVATVTATDRVVTGLSPSTQYTFTVRAIDAAGNVSANSNAVTVTTAAGQTGVTPWAPNTAYAVNALVSYNGATYKCIQAHTSLQGWEPSNVPALWQLQ